MARTLLLMHLPILLGTISEGHGHTGEGSTHNSAIIIVRTELDRSEFDAVSVRGYSGHARVSDFNLPGPPITVFYETTGDEDWTQGVRVAEFNQVHAGWNPIEVSLLQRQQVVATKEVSVLFRNLWNDHEVRIVTLLFPKRNRNGLPPTRPLYRWRSSSAQDNALTSGPVPVPPTKAEGYTLHPTQGRVFEPYTALPSLGLKPIHTWWSPGRTDYTSQSDGIWIGSEGEERDPDYEWVEDLGGAFEQPLAGTVPLYHWYNPTTMDNLITSDPFWSLPSDSPRSGYGPVGIQGYVYPASIINAPLRPELFGYRSLRVDGKEAEGNRPLLVLLCEYSDSPFLPGNDPLHYANLILNPSQRSVAGFYHQQSYGRFNWSSAGVLSLSLPDDPSTGSVDESTRTYAEQDPRRHRQRLLRLAAAQGINFQSFDVVEDGQVRTSELGVLIVNSDPEGVVQGNTEPAGLVSLGDVTINLLASEVSQDAGLAAMIHQAGHLLGIQDIAGVPAKNQRYSSAAFIPGMLQGAETVSLDPWHKIRLGWIAPRIFPVNYPGANAYLFAQEQFGDTQVVEMRPIVLFDNEHGTDEFFLLEYRKQSGYDNGLPSSGLVMWTIRREPDFSLSTVEKIVAGPNGILQTLPLVGSDDVAIDWSELPDGVPDAILPGRDFVLQTSPLPFSDDRRITGDVACMVLGQGAVQKGFGSPWRPGRTFRPTFFNGESLGVPILVGGLEDDDNQILVEWKREPLLPRLDSFTNVETPTSTNPLGCHLVRLNGMFPVQGSSFVNMIGDTSTYLCPVLNWGIQELLVQVPHETPAGQYSFEVDHHSRFSNRLPYYLQETVNTPPGIFQFAVEDFSFFESNGLATVLVHRSGGLCGPAVVTYELTEESAEAGVDFSSTSIPVIGFESGQTISKIEVPIIPDAMDEPSESFMIRLVDVTGGGELGTSNTLEVTILDDDPPPTISIGEESFTVEEGDDQSVFLDIPLVLSEPSGFQVEVSGYTASGSATRDVDYAHHSAVTRFPPGVTRFVQRLEVYPDELDEDDEVFTYELQFTFRGVLGRSSAEITILDDDPPPSLSIDDVVVTENDSGARRASFRIRLSQTSEREVSFQARTGDGSAVAGEDYVDTGIVPLVIPPGFIDVPFPVVVTGSPGFEPEERFQVFVENAVNATVDDGIGTGIIIEFMVESIRREGDEIVLSFRSASTGKLYHVDRADRLEGTDTDWIQLTPTTIAGGLIGHGEILEFRDRLDALSQQTHFYRLREVPLPEF